MASRTTSALQRTAQNKLLPTDSPRPSDAPYNPFYGAEWLGQPQVRYGVHQAPDQVSVDILLQAMYDPTVQLCFQNLLGVLINAQFEVKCDDPEKGRIMESMYRRVREQYILQASPAQFLGFQGLVKKLGFVDPKEIDGWNKPDIQPYTILGFQQIHPLSGEAMFKDGHFDGIRVGNKYTGTTIPVFYALWVTRAKHLAFGDYKGFGRARVVYEAWWRYQFQYDLRDIHLQKGMQTTPKIGYPDGKTKEGVSYREIAIEIGNGLLAGGAVALPTTTYPYTDEKQIERPSNIPMWTMEYTNPPNATEAFKTLKTDAQKEICIAMLVPPQALLDAQASQLSGVSTVKLLAQAVGQMLNMDADDLDFHINEYVLPILDAANFPAGGPRVTIKTLPISEANNEFLGQLVLAMLSIPEIAARVQTTIDLQASLKSLAIPLVDKNPTALPTITPEQPRTPSVNPQPAMPTIPAQAMQLQADLDTTDRMLDHDVPSYAVRHKAYLAALASIDL